jgi:hypothetical protein
MENTTMTDGMVPMTGAFARACVVCPQTTNRLLADALGADEGTTVPTSAASRIGTDVALRAGSMGMAPIQGNGSLPFAGYAPTTPKFMDVVHVRSGRPPG